MRISEFKIAGERIPERDFGIVGDFEPPAYNVMQRYCRDRGWIPIDRILKFIDSKSALEIGPGPGYIGLEWLRRTQSTKLIGYDISEDMLTISRSNAEEYGLTERAAYQRGDVMKLTFPDGGIDAVISNDSFHEWAHPIESLNEIYRVLKPGGKFHISDLRRDMNPALKCLIWFMCRPRSLRPGWLTSINASYTKSELIKLLSRTNISNYHIEMDSMRFYIMGSKLS